MNRRDFLTFSAMAAAVAARPGLLLSEEAPQFKTKPKKAWLGTLPDEQMMEKIMSHGFMGMEVQGNASIEDAIKAKKVADRLGFTFHSLMGGNTEERLQLAAALGADTVLLVPGAIGGVPMPQAWEFEIEFDEKTNLLKKVVAGDNTPYQAYIDRHNQEMQAARKRIERLIPSAVEKGIVIAIENVWNNMWVKPNFAANFILSFDHPNVKAYVDLGNHMKYADSREWFQYLGTNIRRIHLKDFKLNPDGRGGRWCRLGEGSVDWALMRREMERIGYDSWCTVEPEGGIQMSMEFQSAAADKILNP
ncbi:MAG: sugar phosphate isomerase/epimerase family protein [Planctomycetia bacterium]|nr:sugar phosphate isomerase/epimerase family protein [Planctomycetia bacterium]